MLLTASYKPERPFVVVVAVSRWHVFLSDMCFPMQTPQGMCGRSGNQTSLFDFSRQCAILCVRKEHVTRNRWHWTDATDCAYCIFATQLTLPWGSRGFSLSARERETSGTQASDSVFGEQNALTFRARTRPQLYMFGGTHTITEETQILCQRKSAACLQSKQDVRWYPPWFFCCKLKVRGRLDEVSLDCSFRKELYRGESHSG